MSLKVELKAGERLLLGECLVTNEGPRTRLCIDGRIPVLREKDIMTEAAADTPTKRLYFAIQTLYLSRDRETFDTRYGELKVLLAASARHGTEMISALVEANEIYKAMKQTRRLIDDEGRAALA